MSALTGGHFAEDPRFNIVRMSFANLSNWVGWKPDLSASSEFKFRESESKLSLDQRNEDLVIEFVLGNQRSLQEIITLCSHVQMLGRIGLNDAASMTKIIISRGKGDDYHEFFTSEIREDNSVDSEEYFQIFKSNTLFHFDDIDGLSGISNWIEVAEKFYPVIVLLKNSRKNSMDHIEINTIRNIIAAESFSAIKYGKRLKNLGKDSLENRLNIMANYAGDTFFKKIEAEQWAKSVVKSRNNSLIHRSSHHHNDSIRKLYWISESLYCLLVLCLLRESGVSGTTLNQVQEHGMLECVMEEVRRYL